jgi:hypothetical protein
MRPPRGRRRLRAEAEVAERGLGEDGERELDRRLHDQDRGDVRQHVLEGDPPLALAERARRGDELARAAPAARWRAAMRANTGTLKMPIATIEVTRPGP